MRVVAFIALVAIAPNALADFTGRVVKVIDGDTLTVLVGTEQIKVRLIEIDAPERRQAFYQRSRYSLARMCAGKMAEVLSSANDRYGRPLGYVSCEGVQANSEQVRRGMAWVFVKYAPARSPLYALEAAARGQHVGLWSDAKPVPPWEWRSAAKRSLPD